MRISLNWLKRYVDVGLAPPELGARLTMAGFPVPSIEPAGGDHAMEVEVTSNRPDLQCHLGIARETAGLVGAAVRVPDARLSATAASDVIPCRVEARDLCPRYTARVVRGLRVGPSPPWLAALLEAAGQRSVNNVVDVTNFVMLECGQPLHAFDLRKLRGPEIVVRRAAGESLIAIDGTKLVVGEGELAICDAERPIALAGVMGGLDTEVSAATRDVVLETALFAPLAIRAASRAHSIRSEASFRFERFVDPASLEWAADRATALLLEVCGGSSAGPLCSDGDAAAREPSPIALRAARIERVLGVAVGEGEVRSILLSLGFAEIPSREPGVSRWRAPSWRPDVAAEIDLIEEVARRAGFARVPAEVRIPVRPAPKDEDRRALRRLRDSMAGAGLRECCTAPFVGDGRDDVALFSDVPALRVENPMRAEESLLRRSLLGPLLGVARLNRDRGVPAVRLFEIAPVYLRGPAAGRDQEALLVSGVITGGYAEAKGCLDSVFEAMGIGEMTFERGAPLPFRPDRSASVRLEREIVGFLGELGRRSLASFGLESATAVFEFRADVLCEHAVLERAYRPVPRHPAMERDLAWVVDEQVTWAEIASAVRAAAGELLADVRPFDVYRGAQVGAGRKSVALRMHLRAPERTLTGDEADACVRRVLARLAAATGGALRA